MQRISKMKKICLMFNHLRHQDGVGRSAIAIANQLTRLKLAEVTLIPLFINDKSVHNLIDKGIRIKPGFGFYFRGMAHIVKYIPFSWLNRWLIGNEYDIEVGFQFGLCTECIAASKTKAVKFAWMHGYDNGLVLKDAYEQIGKVCCVSRCNAERLHQELPTIKVDYNYNPIDDIQVCELGQEVIDIERPSGLLFITSGRLSPEKGFLRLLDVMKRLKDNGYKFHLWIMGDGPDEVILKKKHKELGLEQEVKFLGRQSNPHKFTSKADVFVCSSFSEGYSTVCTEAIMLGVPVVTTGVSGAQEIIDDAECGLLTGTDDESLYQGLRQVCEKPSLAKGWKERLVETKGRFSAEKRIRRLVNLFQL